MDIWRTAKKLADLHGDDAAIHAAMRADKMLESGNLDGAAIWRRVMNAIKEIENKAPVGRLH